MNDSEPTAGHPDRDAAFEASPTPLIATGGRHREANPWPRRLAIANRLLAGVVMAIGVLVLVGYATGSPPLITVLPGYRGMAIVTASCLVLLGTALMLEGFRSRTGARRCATVVLTIGVTVLVAQTIGVGDVFSPWLSRHLTGVADPARTSAATALCLALLAAAIRQRRQARLADLLNLAVIGIAGIGVLGYAYYVGELYALKPFRSMAMHTAIALMLLAVSSVVARPAQGWASIISSAEVGGIVARRQLSFTLVPPILGWLLLDLTATGGLGLNAAMAFLVMLVIIPLVVVVLQIAKVVDAMEKLRAERAAAQQQFEQAYALQLQARLAHQAAELAEAETARSEAQSALARVQRLDALGQLTGGMAHDFNNILMAIGGNLTLLSRSLDSREKADRYIDRSKQAVTMGTKLTSQLLSFSRTQPLKLASVDVDRTVVKVKELLGTLGPNTSIALELDADEGCVRGDADQLELALLNLAFNARDAMPHGGKLTFRTQIDRLAIGDPSRLTEVVRLQIEDTGSGMTPEVAARAVEPFYTTKPRGKGTGLGLAQAFGLMKQCGGDLRIDSEPGRGTTVELLLPRVEPRADPAATPPPSTTRHATPVPARNGLILVVDDDDSVRSSIAESLAKAGHGVIEACDGETGLALARRHSPDLAIIDLIMPGMNGAQMARRARHARPTLPIVFVSGYFDVETLDDIVDATVLKKPFDLDSLCELVETKLAG